MQSTPLLFLAFLLAHLAGDFVFQTRSMVDGKRLGKPGAYLRHGAVHALLAYLAVLAFTPRHLALGRLHLALLTLVLTHLCIDYVKERIASRTATPPWMTFLVDQAVHVSLILVITSVAFSEVYAWLEVAYHGFEHYRSDLLWLLIIYAATVFGGGFLIRLVLPRQTRDETGLSAEERERREDERRLGMYIGWLERVLVLTAVLAKSPTAVGFIVAAKSIVRFKKVEENEEFAEYFLLGTFSSLIFALTGGLLLRWLIWGTLDLE